jgi:hypothetical protein
MSYGEALNCIPELEPSGGWGPKTKNADENIIRTISNTIRVSKQLILPSLEYI